MRVGHHLLLAFATHMLTLIEAEVDPRYARNITMYHVNPLSAGTIPLNMNSGDPAGDLFFYLTQFLLPLECSADPMDWLSKFDCSNPEQVSAELVVTKVDMVIDSRFTGYRLCNLCNGTDPIWEKPCKVGSYHCDSCTAPIRSQLFKRGCDQSFVGKESVIDLKVPEATCGKTLQRTCGRYVGQSTLATARCLACLAWNHRAISEEKCTATSAMSFCSPTVSRPCGEGARDFECWRENIGRKTGGVWYSTLEEGMCQPTSDHQSCSWKVLSTSTVREPCLRQSIMKMAEKASPDCFGACGLRNTSSTCWINCFFTTLLGAEAKHSPKVSGLPLETLVRSWTEPFLPESEGGCPKVPDMPLLATQEASTDFRLPGWLKQRSMPHMEDLAVFGTSSSDSTITV